jgi:hypothetical protein
MKDEKEHALTATTQPPLYFSPYEYVQGLYAALKRSHLKKN